jgi:hypothetical protein
MRDGMLGYVPRIEGSEDFNQPVASTDKRSLFWRPVRTSASSIVPVQEHFHDRCRIATHSPMKADDRDDRHRCAAARVP